MIDQEQFVEEFIIGSARPKAYKYVFETLLRDDPRMLDRQKLSPLKGFRDIYAKLSESEQRVVQGVIKYTVEQTIFEILDLIDRRRLRMIDEHADLVLTWRTEDGKEVCLAGDTEGTLTFLSDIFGAMTNDLWV
ncbi:hypothetical protein J0O71_14880, partial [Listeria monocytogenes]|nr:hypothetical protein [Listeria monocytogenes]